MPLGRAQPQRCGAATGYARCAYSRVDASVPCAPVVPLRVASCLRRIPHFHIPGAGKRGKSDRQKEHAAPDYCGHPFSVSKTLPWATSCVPADADPQEARSRCPRIFSRLHYTGVRCCAVVPCSRHASVVRRIRSAPVTDHRAKTMERGGNRGARIANRGEDLARIVALSHIHFQTT